MTWVGTFTSAFDSLFTVRSVDLYSGITFGSPGTWNAIIAHGPYTLESSGVTRFELQETGPDVYAQSYSATGRTITFAAVPEPSTCVMALAGTACGGYSMFRRRKRA